MIITTVINNATGEVLTESHRFYEEGELEKLMEKKKRYAIHDQETKAFRQFHNENMGNFVFFIFKNMDKLRTILDDADLVRFVMLGTYCKKEGRLMLDNNKTLITKKNMKTILESSKTVFNNFYNKLIQNNLIIEDDIGYRINMEYFHRGNKKDYKDMTNEELSDNFTRLYIETTRSLYKNTNSKKKLAIIYKLLQFVNWKYNILCENIEEVDQDKLKVLTIGKVMEYLGYSESNLKSNLSKFERDFYSFKVGNEVVFMSMKKHHDTLKSVIYVNPSLYYRGSTIEDLDYLIKQFRV